MLLRKSHRSSADRKGYKADALLTAQASGRLWEVSVPESGGGGQGHIADVIKRLALYPLPAHYLLRPFESGAYDRC